MIDLSESIKSILETEVIRTEKVIKSSGEKTAKIVVNNIKNDSPKNTGRYKKGWTFKVTNKGVIIFNKKYGGLTHLLEKGHLKVGGVGRVPPQPHIKENEQKGINIFISEIEKELKV